MKTPDLIRMIVTERDRKGAGEVDDNRNCLIAYMLKRRGYTKVSVGVFGATINDVRYSTLDGEIPFDHVSNSSSGPRYKKSAVGKKITFTLGESNSF